MSNNNPAGVNGYGPKNYPASDILRAELHQYAKERLTTPQRLQRLQLKFGLKIGKTKLNELNNLHNVPSPRKPPSADVALQAVLEKVADDTAQKNGVGTILTLLGNEGMSLPRDFVREVLAQHAPEGLSARFPGAKRIRRSALVALGPNYQHHADGHDKLGAQALQMGGVGLYIYGIKDQWSSFLLHLVVVPNNRLATTIGHVYLDCVEKYGFVSITFVMDKGSETKYVFACQTALRTIYAPDIDTEKYQPALHLRSVHNTPIEGLWHWYSETSGVSIKDEIHRGYTDGIFHVGEKIHMDLFNWLWPQILQTQLDMFVEYWNNHKIRRQNTKPNASGTTPRNAFMNPKSVSPQAEECRIEVDQAVLNALRDDIGVTREDAMKFVDDDFARKAQDTYLAIGSPALKPTSGWSIFSAMLVQL